MDIYGLAATHIHAQPRPTPMSAQAEDRYYASQIGLPLPHPQLLKSIAAIASVILLLGTSLI